MMPGVRAAILHGPDDLRVEDIPAPLPEPDEVLVRVEAATTCGTDVKMWRRGHPILPPYPARFGHETAGVREDTGERVLVGDSVACGTCRPCAAGRPQICRAPRWVLGGFAELIAAPVAALHVVPDGLELAGAAMAEPLAAAVHAVDRAPARAIAPDAGVLGGGPMGQMLAALLVAEGRTVTLADHHAERRAQAETAGAMSVGTLADHDVVFEAVGRPDAWRAAVQACAPGGCVVFVGGCATGSDAQLPTHPLHYDELDLRGAFHHAPAEVDRALALLAAGTVDWRALAAGPIGLDELPAALAAGNDGPARKWVVRPA
jgi:L-iditol 2-dehydrogenase